MFQFQTQERTQTPTSLEIVFHFIPKAPDSLSSRNRLALLKMPSCLLKVTNKNTFLQTLRKFQPCKYPFLKADNFAVTRYRNQNKSKVVFTFTLSHFLQMFRCQSSKMLFHQICQTIYCSTCGRCYFLQLRIMSPSISNRNLQLKCYTDHVFKVLLSKS